MEKSQLPIEVDTKKGLTVKTKRQLKRFQEGIIKTGKIALNIGAAILGLGISGIGGPIGAALGLGIYLTTATNAIYKTLVKNYDDIIFISRKNAKGETYVAQDVTNIKMMKQMNKIANKYQKICAMGLQLLVGMQRYKQELSDKNASTVPSKDGEGQVYTKIFSTITHSDNIKTLEALEALGYIEIDSIQDKGKRMLITAKLGFGEYDAAKNAIVALITGDEEKKEEYSRMMQQIRFRLTDKPLNLDEIYEQYLQVKGKKVVEPRRRGIKIIGSMLDMLRSQNIDIRTNELGMISIDYNAETSFANRKNMKLGYSNKQAKFHKDMRDGVDPQTTEKAVTEHQAKVAQGELTPPSDKEVAG